MGVNGEDQKQRTSASRNGFWGSSTLSSLSPGSLQPIRIFMSTLSVVVVVAPRGEGCSWKNQGAESK